jgi:hypothetical protein
MNRIPLFLALFGCQQQLHVDAHGAPAAAAPPPARCAPGVAAEIRNVAYPDLQDALNDAQPYDTVIVCPGVWQGNFVLPNHAGPLEVRGLTGDPADVILDGGGGAETLLDPRGGSSRLRGLTFQNAETLVNLSGWEANDRLEVLDCQFLGPALNGLDIDGPTVIIKNTYFTGFSGFESQALRASPSRRSNANLPGLVLLEDVTFEDNPTWYGNAALDGKPASTPTNPDTFILRRVHFYNNDSDGAVLEITEPWSARILIEDSEFIGNSSQAYAPIRVTTLLHDPSDTFVMGIDRTLFADNFGGDGTALHLDADRDRAIYTDRVHFGIRDSAFLRNRSNGSHSDPGNIAALMLWGDAYVHLRNVDFGTGADDNEGSDIIGCADELGGGVTGDIEPYICP